MKTGLVLVLIVVGSLLASPISGQSKPDPTRPLAGFQYLHVVAPTYDNDPVDVMNLKPYLQNQLRVQRWVILSDQEVAQARSNPERASAMMSCGIGHSATDNISNSVTLTCVDAFFRPMFSVTESGTGLTLKGDLEAAIRKIVARVKEMRPRFDPNLTVDIVSSLTPAQTVSISESDIDGRIARGDRMSPLEGIWTRPSDGARYVVVPAGARGEYSLVLVSDISSLAWTPGMVRATLSEAADGSTFLLNWRGAWRQTVTGTATLRGATLALTLRDGVREQVIELLKLRPAVAASVSAFPTDPGTKIGRATGTAFFCAPDLVATNQHVIDGAESIELYLPRSQRTLKLDLVVADKGNDVAILRVRSDGQPLPRAVALVDSTSLRLGASAIVVGFPLGATLGTDHKVTTGVISGMDGFEGDPRMFQLTAPIQPGSSGSPVFDQDGRVMGIVVSTLDAIEVARAAGHIPQNVNFAIKADYLALLLRRTASQAEPQRPNQNAVSQTDLVERVRDSVGQVRVIR